MKKSTIIFGLALFAMTGMSYAEMRDMSQHQMAMQQSANPMKHEGRGIIKSVNIKDQKVQIAHEAISTLKWPAMTMWFVLGNPLPEDIHVGDKVRFDLEQPYVSEKPHSKKWIITHIDKQ